MPLKRAGAISAQIILDGCLTRRLATVCEYWEQLVPAEASAAKRPRTFRAVRGRRPNGPAQTIATGVSAEACVAKIALVATFSLL